MNARAHHKRGVIRTKVRGNFTPGKGSKSAYAQHNLSEPLDGGAYEGDKPREFEPMQCSAWTLSKSAVSFRDEKSSKEIIGRARCSRSRRGRRGGGGVPPTQDIQSCTES
jgi:hypothetical protein